MSLSQSEIFNQYKSLTKTYELFEEKRGDILSVLGGYNRFVFFGCGSSYSLAKSAAMSASIYGADGAVAIAAGDYIVNHEQYSKALEGACVVFISRSGRTSEMIIAAELILEHGINCAMVSVCATEDAPMCRYTKLNVEIPWAFDNSVCQTQTVSNLYVSCLLLMALRYEDKKLTEQLRELIAGGEEYLASLSAKLEKLYDGGWEKAVVLCDGSSTGIAEEGALAFNEICMMPSNYYHVLDVRHGPMVLIKDKTIAVMLFSSAENERQLALLNDIKALGAYTIVLAADEAFAGADMFIKIPDYDHALAGLMLVNAIQILALGIAKATGVDPDKPKGLDAWIKL